MKKWLKVAALVLCMALAFPAALAQEKTYTVGEPTRDAFSDAFASGQLVSVEIALDLKLDGQSLGMTAEEAQTLSAVLDALRQANITVGAGRIDEGVRIALEAEVKNAEGGNPVSVNALADVTLDGIAVESDLIPGKRMTAKWETLLALCGVPQESIDAIMSLRSIDSDSVMEVLEEALNLLEEALEQVEPMVEMIVQLATPYAQTIVEFVQTLPIEVRENLSEENYPETAAEYSITVTQKDLGTLLTLLCDQLDQDATLKIMLNALLEQAEMGVTVEEIIGEIRGAAQEMTDTDTSVTFFLGMNEEGVPMYGEIYVYNKPTQESIYGGLFLYRDADGAWVFELTGGLYDQQNIPAPAGYIGARYARDSMDSDVYDVTVEVFAVEGEQSLAEMVLTLGSEKTGGDVLPAYDKNVVMNLYAAYDEGLQVVFDAKRHRVMTASGGEMSSATSAMDVYVGDSVTAATGSIEQLVEPTADGGVVGYTRVKQVMPLVGIDKLEASILYASEEIDMAASQALEQISLETATNVQMDALKEDVLAVLSGQKLPALMENLPPELLQMIAE